MAADRTLPGEGPRCSQAMTPWTATENKPTRIGRELEEKIWMANPDPPRLTREGTHPWVTAIPRKEADD